MNNLSDKAYSTLQVLRNATWLNNDDEIKNACREVYRYLKEIEEQARIEKAI